MNVRWQVFCIGVALVCGDPNFAIGEHDVAPPVHSVQARQTTTRPDRSISSDGIISESISSIPTTGPETIDVSIVDESSNAASENELASLEAMALENNATLRRMRLEAAAAWAKTGYLSKLPDPSVSSTVYTPPMTFDPDRQLGELQVMQMIPWLGRLKAEGRQAHYEALAAQTDFEAERLRVLGDLRVNWYRLYVVRRQIETAQAEKTQIESLIQTANAQIRTGNAQPGDVLMATLELSSLQEQFLTLRQQELSTAGEINRLLGRDASVPLAPVADLVTELPAWTMDSIQATAKANQPELNAARLRTAAARWGIEVARLRRRPDLTFGAGWVAMDAPGAVMPGAGRDSFSLSMSATIPLWQRKYDAMVSEASRQHRAAHASVDEVEQRLDATLVDLWQQALAADQTIALYKVSILPQARQTLHADQESFGNGTVPFDRVVRDYRTFINLQLGYEKAVGQLAIALARLRQTIGTDHLIEGE